MTYFQEIAEIYINNLGIIAISVGLLVAIEHVVFYAIKRISPDLYVIILKTLAGVGIPIGFGLILCAFDIDLIGKLVNAPVYILVSGITIIYISLISIFPKPRTSSTPPPAAQPPSPPAPRNT
jgi:hypothetical protein